MDFSKISCEKDCQFTMSDVSETCMYFPPIYDKSGINTNPDRNHQNATVKCYTCNKVWDVHKLVCDEQWEYKETENPMPKEGV